MATLEELKRMALAAHRQGNMSDAAKLVAMVDREERRRAENPTEWETEQAAAQLPDSDGVLHAPGTVFEAPTPDGPGVLDVVAGAPEAALSMATGATGGTVGTLAGVVEGVTREIASGEFGSADAADRIQETAERRASQLTYAPRGEGAQAITQAVGDVGGQLAAIPVAQAATVGALAAGARPAAAAATRQAAQAIPQRRATDKSVGAAQVEGGAALALRTDAEELGFTGDRALMRGQAGEGADVHDDIRFEKETAKLAEDGAPIRERVQNQTAHVENVFDDFMDATEGSIRGDATATGGVLVDALAKQKAASKKRISHLYEQADEAGEMSEPVDMSSLSTYLNDNRAARSENSIMGKVQAHLEVIEKAAGDFKDGSLNLQTMNLREAESVRRFINKNANDLDTNDLRIASEIKRVIDDATEDAGGTTYKKARAARAKLAREFERAGLVDALLSTKRGTDDRKVALEKVLEKTVLSATTSAAELQTVGRLAKKTPEGRKAWKEVQLATVEHLKSQAQRSITKDAAGNTIITPAGFNKALDALAKGGKLNYLFGHKGARQLDTLRDVINAIHNAPPGSVNHSGTASALANLVDFVGIGTGALPVPVATLATHLSKRVKDARLKAKIKEHLKE